MLHLVMSLKGKPPEQRRELSVRKKEHRNRKYAEQKKTHKQTNLDTKSTYIKITMLIGKNRQK